MNRIVLLSLLAVISVGCSAPNEEISQTPVQKPVAVAATEETTESAPVETTPSTIESFEDSSDETVQAQAEPVKPAKTITSKPLSVAPTNNREILINRNEDENKRVVVYQPQNVFVFPTKLVANIRKNIGCGAVDNEYKAQVMAMVIAEDSPKAVKKLSERQFYQAVRQTIGENQAQANDLVAQYRESNCSIASKQYSKIETKLAPTPRTSVTNGVVVPVQSGNCKDLKARGFNDIDVSVNPWASWLDRDKDGIACEAN
ncbi:MAG: excalibur calcium-binding domain-containing protein [Calothrix sp. FI2-JRJ7]|jgi:hypothetical protein|nr:excalibur calcium-binding domain-containing protein [Calothrix sp. FI2-JRJ7]